MAKIRLNESELKCLIREAIKKVTLNEYRYDTPKFNYEVVLETDVNQIEFVADCIFEVDYEDQSLTNYDIKLIHTPGEYTDEELSEINEYIYRNRTLIFDKIYDNAYANFEHSLDDRY